MRGFMLGLLVGILFVVGSLYFYFASGMAPAAAGDPPIPFEKMLASKSLDAHMEKQNIPSPPILADEQSLLAGAATYVVQCAGCHGLPDQAAPVIGEKMYPPATLLFKDKGVTDDPPQESFWKVSNGIRLTGMPSFKGTLTDTQLWQVAQLVANANKISDPVKTVLTPGLAPTILAPPQPAKP